MIPDRDNKVYYDTEKNRFYLITWKDGGTCDIPTRHYIPDLRVKDKNARLHK